MKPTQQEITELAREAGFGIGQGISAIRINGYADDLLRLAELLLERFGAGGGEPVAWMSPGKERLEFSRKDTVYGSHTIPLYTHPSPTDLRAEYLRGLDDAKKVALDADHMGSVNLKLMKNRISDAIEALKGK